MNADELYLFSKPLRFRSYPRRIEWDGDRARLVLERVTGDPAQGFKTRRRMNEDRIETEMRLVEHADTHTPKRRQLIGFFETI